MSEKRNTPSDDFTPAADDNNIFGEVISSYSRAEAIADGVLHDVTEMARESGIRIPTAVTAQLMAEYIEPPAGLEAVGQSREGRLWDVLFMLRAAVVARPDGGDTLLFKVMFLLADKRLHKVELKAVCGPGDTPEPVITIMLPHED